MKRATRLAAIDLSTHDKKSLAIIGLSTGRVQLESNALSAVYTLPVYL
jgi:hypothetical protein